MFFFKLNPALNANKTKQKVHSKEQMQIYKTLPTKKTGKCFLTLKMTFDELWNR